MSRGKRAHFNVHVHEGNGGGVGWSDVKDINGFVKIMEMAVVKTQSGGRDTQID